MASSMFYGGFIRSAFNKEIDLDSDTLKLMLCSSAYVPDVDTHRYKNHITNEVTGPGYTAGGATLGTVTVNYDTSGNIVSFTAPAVTWPASTITARYGILYDATPATDATRPLILCVDFGGNISSTAATFTVAWDEAGIGAVTLA